jgi:hypothetical protein
MKNFHIYVAEIPNFQAIADHVNDFVENWNLNVFCLTDYRFWYSFPIVSTALGTMCW